MAKDMAKAELMNASDFERISAEISSDESPVGIDAKKTHVMILFALERLEKRMANLEQRLDDWEQRG